MALFKKPAPPAAAPAPAAEAVQANESTTAQVEENSAVVETVTPPAAVLAEETHVSAAATPEVAVVADAPVADAAVGDDLASAEAVQDHAEFEGRAVGRRCVLSGHGVELFATAPGARNDMAGYIDGERVVARIGVGEMSKKPFLSVTKVTQTEGGDPVFSHVGYAYALNTLRGKVVGTETTRFMLLNPAGRRMYITKEMPPEMFQKLGFLGEQSVVARAKPQRSSSHALVV